MFSTFKNRGTGFKSRGKGFQSRGKPLKRSGFGITTSDCSAVRVPKDIRARKPLNRRGPKTKAWESARAKLKRRFEAVGITTCELRGKLPHDCTYDDQLGFAHDAKRRKLSEEDLMRVVLICNNAHDIIEFWPAEEMKKIVNDTIAARPVQP